MWAFPKLMVVALSSVRLKCPIGSTSETWAYLACTLDRRWLQLLMLIGCNFLGLGTAGALSEKLWWFGFCWEALTCNRLELARQWHWRWFHVICLFCLTCYLWYRVHIDWWLALTFGLILIPAFLISVKSLLCVCLCSGLGAPRHGCKGKQLIHVDEVQFFIG